MSQMNSKLKTTKNNTKMESKLIYDVKGKVNNVEKSYNEMTDDEIKELMNTERFSLTCAPGGENNRGMEIIGRMPIKGEGFTAKDIEGLGPYFKDKVEVWINENGLMPVTVLDLNKLSEHKTIIDLKDDDQARVLILRDYISNWHGGQDSDIEIYKELASKRWDAEYLDPNKYRTEIKDGKEVKVRGKRMNKRARTNLCFVPDREQEPAVFEGKGTIYDLKKMNFLNAAVERLRNDIANGLIEIGSKTKVVINVVEGNRYYNLKTTGIGFHGDTERVVVICLSIGGSNYPMRWQWFHDGMPAGNEIDITLNSGDVYIMSEKAVGADWKKKSLWTLRHAAGANKYRSLSKWEKRWPAYNARVQAKSQKNVEYAVSLIFKSKEKADKKAEKIKIKVKKKKDKKVAMDKTLKKKSIKLLEWAQKNGYTLKDIVAELEKQIE